MVGTELYLGTTVKRERRRDSRPLATPDGEPIVVGRHVK
jgi:hypothetical protein